METPSGTTFDIIRSVMAARVISWVDGSQTGMNPLGPTEQSDEEIIASLPYQEIGQRVEFIHIDRYVLTTYLDGIVEKKVASAPIATSQKYRVVRIPGATRLNELRRQYGRELPVHPTLSQVMHVFADERVDA